MDKKLKNFSMIVGSMESSIKALIGANKFKNVSMLISIIKELYFSSKDTATLFLCIKNIIPKFMPVDWQQELRECEDSEISGSSLCVHVIGKHDVNIRVSGGGHLLVWYIWEVKKCS